MKRFSWIILVISGIINLSCVESEKQLPFYNTPDFTPHFLSSDQEVESKITHSIADFEMKNQHNQTITQKDIEGKIHVANFIFTSCGSICPVMTENMKIVDDEFSGDNDIQLMSYTVTPWIDNVEVLNEYVTAKEITSENWHFLTGTKGEIYQLARQSYFAEEDLGFTKDSTEFLHTEHFILVDQNKKIRGIYNGTLKLEMRQLVKDIQVLKEEA
ncbi:SCO family protein [Flammeovirga sp. EKP202]|uniref:SCO family protein n=1 Tax=Flammeovirga sp. EKP202 TaxID=2770592 RepID=UPI00165FEE72|nr:SCO family protein [Flammeovirga sp. EKP202]MBD0403935.1 SCO family protein [Flammeovirga sp. EKP202]